MRLSRELLYVSASFGVIAMIRVLSSIVLTRILYPEAYGVVAIVASIVFTIEMLSDLGIATLIVRHEKAETDIYLSTLWTIRLIRCVVNAGIVFTAAPILAEVYSAPVLTVPLQFFSIFFLLQGLESMSLLRAVRNKGASKVAFIEVISLILGTIVSITISMQTRDHVGIIAAIIVSRGITTGCSYFIGDSFRPRFAMDRQVCRDLYVISRFVLPSSLLTVAITQFDKVVFLRLFEFSLLGLYGLASTVIQAVDSIILNLAQNVLFPQVADAFRRSRDSVLEVYYIENARLHLLIILLPAIIGGGSSFIVSVLFDLRYNGAVVILQAFAIRSILSAFYTSSETLLVASGHNHIGLTGNILRAVWIIPGVLLGYQFFGFDGFLLAIASNNVPGLCYYLWLQRKERLLVLRYEVYRVTLVVVAFLGALAAAPVGLLAIDAFKIYIRRSL